AAPVGAAEGCFQPRDLRAGEVEGDALQALRRDRRDRRFAEDPPLPFVVDEDFVIEGVVAAVPGLWEELFVCGLFGRGRRGQAAADEAEEEKADPKRAQAGILRC